jgi:gas vesicle protein
MCKKKNFVGGILLGAIVGAVAGILFAPTAGKETRKKLKKMVDAEGEFIKDTKEKTEEVARNTIDSIKQGIEKIGRYIDEKRGHSQPPHDDDNSEAAA